MSLGNDLLGFQRGRNAPRATDAPPPIRAELFSVERLEAHARSLAEAQGHGRVMRGRPLVKRLAENERVLLDAYRDTIRTQDEGGAITPAAEWLIDNFHLIEKQIREVRLDLPGRYYRELPKIESGHLAGFPRVYGITWAYVAHTDSRFETETFCRFIRAYEEVQPLAIGELWALAITLRVTLVENLRRIAERIVASRWARKAADVCCDRILGHRGRPAEPAGEVLSAAMKGRLPHAFAAQLAHRLRDGDTRAAAALTWLDERLARQNETVDEMIQEEQQRQVSATATVRNVMTSMRLISDVDWADLVERISLVDDVLRSGSAFADMDFSTRNLYRTAIEDIARGAGVSELDVAARAIGMARGADDLSGAGRRCEPGYYLVDAGRRALEAAVGYRPPPRTWLPRGIRKLGIGAYAAAILAIAALLLWVPMFLLFPWAPSAALAALAVLGVFPALDAAIALVNRGVTGGFRATALPALELKSGVPQKLRTVVAVPVLFARVEDVEAQLARLEIHYLASPEGDLHFALLSDWADASEETTGTDKPILQAATAGIAALNARYGAAPGGDRFLLFHRRRVWSDSEGCWMGWERKRGKLHELNRRLRGAQDTTFLPVAGQAVPAGVRYVITLDADTRLPRDSVRRLIGKMAHPLNRPVFDPAAGRVVEGYAILQPRVTPALPSHREASLFRRIFSSLGGIDPYAAAVSDVYQDLFGEGSFTGKGIYEIDAFESALAGRAPEGALLSHDLFEGVFARAGLASDVEVVEDFPDRYDVAAARHHRWARGDWQLLPWILGVAPAPGARRPPPTPTIGRWKMIDNLRRTLSPPATLLSLWLAWASPAAVSAIWTLFVLATFAVPPTIPVLAALRRRRPGVGARVRLQSLASDLRFALLQVALLAAFLADQAWLMGDAIVRTLWRLFVSRRHLLEWTPAAMAAARLRFDRASFFRRMAPAVALGVITLAIGGFALREAGWLALPFGIAWTLSPLLAFRVSQPLTPAERQAPSEEEMRRLRLIARRTWRYFERFVTAEDNHLPPDNYQEDPEVLARRTSPTNMGLYLLAVASAHDFGWLDQSDALGRLEATLNTLDRMERLRGHFFNWYDTRDLTPLEPRYVSSVDSGNLAGHLIALANAVEDWAAAEAPANALAGARDAADILAEEIASRGQAAPESLRAGVAALREALATRADRSELLRLADATVGAAEAAAAQGGDTTPEDIVFWARAARGALTASPAPDVAARAAKLAGRARRLAGEMDFGFLLDPKRMLLSIGYRVRDGELESNCYDLLGSEARLASFMAIAKGDAPPRHWFRLSHAVTPVRSGAALISWSGSMFEYLMPALVMREPPGSMLETTNRLVVARHRDYAASLGVPWGMSESAYNVRDLHLTYQYKSFGVPSLGLKRGLDDEIVIAPYATALAAMVDARAAAQNYVQLAGLGARGRYGFYEAIDFTPTRVPEGEDYALVRAYMAHHQGMTIVAIGNALKDGLMQERFHAEPSVRATELLLEERMPREVVISQPRVARRNPATLVQELEVPARRITDPATPTPALQVLSNGAYSVMLTAAGSGYSRWREVAVTRWREDSTCDDHGAYTYLRDPHSGEWWSAGHQPGGGGADHYEASFSEDRCEFVRRDGTITTRLEVIVSAEDDAEVRRISLTNDGLVAREIEVTSYAELVLAPEAVDAAHPAFSKMFVETAHEPASGALLATRRRRSPADPEVWAAQLAVVEGEIVAAPDYETDRAQFLGRGRDTRAPVAVADGRPLRRTVGAVLDPIFSLRRRVRVPPGGVVRISFWTLVAPTRKAVLDLVDKHQDPAAFDRVANLAWTQALVQLHHLGISRGEAALFQRLVSHLVYSSPALRPPSEVLRDASGGQPGLWRLALSGDLPIVVLRISDPHELGLARQLVRAVEYWRSKRVAFDFVLLNERAVSYVQDLQAALETLVQTAQSHGAPGRSPPPGRTVVLRADVSPPEACKLLLASARIVISAQGGSLGDLADRLEPPRAAASPVPRTAGSRERPAPVKLPELEFFNGFGGFDRDGREYVVLLEDGQTTPAPWINVVANPDFGFQVSADGAGFTWRRNSREHQLTPWSTDPVSDRSGEALFLLDEETGELWSPTAHPIRLERAAYVARHGRGYSRFVHHSHGLESELTQFVPLGHPLKISRLTLRNPTARPRRLRITAYAEWALGASRAAAPFTITSIDPQTGALFARNGWNPDFDGVAFADLAGRQTRWTCDRREFLGRNGSLAAPAALTGHRPLSGAVGAALDPCSALQAQLEVPPFANAEVVWFLGEADSEEAARALLQQYRAADLDGELAEVEQFWDQLTGQVQVKTPDRSFDLLLNGGLLYQALACRMWARGGFYQTSGAYGFRDQLQDAMAVASLMPDLTRDHLLRAAARQFPEGDVQHWWLPHSGQGVRTRISDDRIWLAYATAHYVTTTGDLKVLDETRPFLMGTPLAPGEAERFFQPAPTEQVATLYEHCARALDVSLELGGHGLPLIGTGDWNDGMNRVGERGLGESVWLGWFLYASLQAFLPFAEQRGDRVRATVWRNHATVLQAALERNGWDGDWYRRGWFDDGTPLGSAASEECRIDAIAQSWAVLSGAAPPDRARAAMAALDRELVRRTEKLALLFTPPFDKTSLDPGYIKAYPPGVRENGGQYTHAAAWSVFALTQLGDGARAAELFALINPINHALTQADALRYRLEPYVAAGDVYAAPGRVGQGGWSWYTGSAGWLHRAGLEGILGLRREGAEAILDPCIPPDWPKFEIILRVGASRYHILVENPDARGGGVAFAELDGRRLAPGPARFTLLDDEAPHEVRIRLGCSAPVAS